MASSWALSATPDRRFPLTLCIPISVTCSARGIAAFCACRAPIPPHIVQRRLIAGEFKDKTNRHNNFRASANGSRSLPNGNLPAVSKLNWRANRQLFLRRSSGWPGRDRLLAPSTRVPDPSDRGAGHIPAVTCGWPPPAAPRQRPSLTCPEPSRWPKSPRSVLGGTSGCSSRS